MSGFSIACSTQIALQKLRSGAPWILAIVAGLIVTFIGSMGPTVQTPTPRPFAVAMSLETLDDDGDPVPARDMSMDEDDHDSVDGPLVAPVVHAYGVALLPPELTVPVFHGLGPATGVEKVPPRPPAA